MNTRTFTSVGLIAILLMVTGCSTSRQILTLPPVGPATETSSEPASGTGTLIVFSAYEIGEPPPGERASNQRHTDYLLVSEDSGLSRTISNQRGAYRPDPAPVGLHPGRYRVTARANGFGEVSVPVVIVANRTTEVHLEGGARSTKDFAAANQPVVLPDGTVVGWRAN